LRFTLKPSGQPLLNANCQGLFAKSGAKVVIDIEITGFILAKFRYSDSNTQKLQKSDFWQPGSAPTLQPLNKMMNCPFQSAL
jgi:hypothetical protein